MSMIAWFVVLLNSILIISVDCRILARMRMSQEASNFWLWFRRLLILPFGYGLALFVSVLISPFSFDESAIALSMVLPFVVLTLGYSWRLLPTTGILGRNSEHPPT